MRELKKSMKDFLEVFNNVTVPDLIEQGFEANPINAREGLLNTTYNFTTSKTEIAKVMDGTVKSKDGNYNVPVRIFNPNPEEALPVIIYFHGGGHMAGSVTVYDEVIRRLAKETNHIVVAPEFRLAPENPYPAQEIDSRTVYYNVFDLLDEKNVKYQKKLRFGGDSGGGALTAALARDIQDDSDDYKADAIFMIYPSLDYTMSFDSYKDDVNGKGYLLETPKIKWYFDNYLQDGQDRKEASPLFNKISNGIPRTILFTAEFCPLRDEGYAYVEKLKENGVEVVHHNMENMIHTYMSMQDLAKEEADFTYAEISKFLNR